MAEAAEEPLSAPPSKKRALAKGSGVTLYCGGGSSYYHRTRSKLPPGPASPDAFAAWPVSVLESLGKPRGGESQEAGAIRIARMTSILRGGFVLHTDYSGQMSPEVCIAIAAEGLRRRGCPLPEEVLVRWRACDWDQTCRNLIQTSPHPPEHLFESIQCRLPAELQAYIVAARPQKTASKDETTQAYKKMKDFIWANKANVFHREMKAPCLLHPGCDCPLAWRDPPGAPPSRRPLTANFSGTQCTPWSSLGARAGLTDKNSESWYIWLAEMSTMRYDMTFLENAPHPMPLKMLQEELAPWASVVHVMVGPEAGRRAL